MTEPDKDDIALDAFFAAARQARPEPGDDLMSRILADAVRLQSAVAEPVAVPPSAPGWRGIFAFVGGWPAMGGMAAATLAGIWIGMSPPQSLTTWAGGILGETVSVPVYADDDPLALLEG